MLWSKDKRVLVLRAVVLYTAGGDYSDEGDTLAQMCTDAEWAEFEALFPQIDEWMVDAGLGTVTQTEQVLARRESRQDRTRGFLFRPETETEPIVVALADEFRQRGIAFQD